MHAAFTLAIFVINTALAVLYAERKDWFWAIACTVLALLQVFSFWQVDFLIT